MQGAGTSLLQLGRRLQSGPGLAQCQTLLKQLYSADGGFIWRDDSESKTQERSSMASYMRKISSGAGQRFNIGNQRGVLGLSSTGLFKPKQKGSAMQQHIKALQAQQERQMSDGHSAEPVYTVPHPFHLVEPSPWPAMLGFTVGAAGLGGVAFMHAYPYGSLLLTTGLLGTVYGMSVWFRDVLREGNMHHTAAVQRGLELGVILFIASEAMFFFGFLWSFVHYATLPSMALGLQWPPPGIVPVDWTRRPLVNSALLGTSYFTANLALKYMESNNKKMCSTMLASTIGLGALFAFYQYLEYSSAPFTFMDSTFGSIFYLTTGFHGFHVIVGSIWLAVCLGSLATTTPAHCVGLRMAVLYWHFVDIVWVFLMAIIYGWGS